MRRAHGIDVGREGATGAPRDPRTVERGARSLLDLQRTAGNHAVGVAVQRGIFDLFKKKKPVVVSGPQNGRAMTKAEQGGALSGAEVEAKKKEDDRGLAGSKLTAAFADRVLAYWRDPGNADKPCQDLATFMLGQVNASLQGMGSFPCNVDLAASDDDLGSFDRSSWTISMNPARFSSSGATKVGELTRDEVAEVVDTVYHEARHSEQYFRIARIQAGSGKAAKAIMDGMSIPADVAKAASAAPMAQDAPNRELIKEAGAWEAFTVGKYQVYKGEVASLRDLQSELLAIFNGFDPKKKKATWDAMRPKRKAIEVLFADFFEPKLQAIEKITPRDKADETVLADIKAMKSAWTPLRAEMTAKQPSVAKLLDLRHAFYLARYAAYMNYEHEVDAWATGGGAAKAFKEAADKPALVGATH